MDDTRKWWKARNNRGQVAHVPHTIVTPHFDGPGSDVFNNPLYARGYGQGQVNPLLKKKMLQKVNKKNKKFKKFKNINLFVC